MSATPIANIVVGAARKNLQIPRTADARWEKMDAVFEFAI
jgi:hypothetical protein